MKSVNEQVSSNYVETFLEALEGHALKPKPKYNKLTDVGIGFFCEWLFILRFISSFTSLEVAHLYEVLLLNIACFLVNKQ